MWGARAGRAVAAGGGGGGAQVVAQGEVAVVVSGRQAEHVQVMGALAVADLAQEQVAGVEGGLGAVLVAKLFDLVTVAVELVQVIEAGGDVDGGLGRETGDGGAADVLDHQGCRAEDGGQAGELGREGASQRRVGGSEVHMSYSHAG